jgi:hypothetical protein
MYLPHRLLVLLYSIRNGASLLSRTARCVTSFFHYRNLLLSGRNYTPTRHAMSLLGLRDGAGYACLTNNLCQLTEFVANPIDGQSEYVRGSCTDKTWNSEFCPNVCITPSNNDNWSGGMGVNKCAGDKDRYWCINNQTEPLSTSDICSSSTYFFEFASKYRTPFQ